MNLNPNSKPTAALSGLVNSADVLGWAGMPSSRIEAQGIGGALHTVTANDSFGGGRQLRGGNYLMEGWFT